MSGDSHVTVWVGILQASFLSQLRRHLGNLALVSTENGFPEKEVAGKITNGVGYEEFHTPAVRSYPPRQL